MKRKRIGIGILLATLVVTACADQPSDGPDQPGLLVIATTTVLGEVLQNLVGEAGRVETLMQVGADPHDFEPSARQAASLREADLVVINGEGLEQGFMDVIAAAEQDGANILEIAPRLDPLPFAPEHQEREGEAGPGSGGHDPHFWQDPVRMARAVDIIGPELAELAGEGVGAEILARADSYRDQILAAHEEIVSILTRIENRKMVTNHEASGYFAARYDFEVIGVVIPGGSTLAEPSPAEIADLVDVIRTQGVRAIFAENTNPALLAEAVAAELGEEVAVVELFSDSIGPLGSPAGTYLGMIEENARRVAEALR
jgi:zinc/manganese transport system substrate-binding protein